MSNNNIYPIQLLNDLHNWYPDVLYNPGRFRNVQDLLEYIRQGADMNPYTRGLQFYNARQRSGYPEVAASRPAHAPHGSDIRTGSAVSTGPAAAASATFPISQNVQPQIRARFHSVPISSSFSVDNDGVTTIFDNIPMSSMAATSILNQLFSPGILQNFLNQTVIVSPSEEDIARATAVSTVLNTQDDICTICQEAIEEGQSMRKINHCNHYFHQDCIDTWFQGNVHCPTCRYDIRDTPTTAANSNAPPPVPSNHRRTNIRDNRDS